MIEAKQLMKAYFNHEYLLRIYKEMDVGEVLRIYSGILSVMVYKVSVTLSMWT
jgi:hypothetical protein